MIGASFFHLTFSPITFAQNNGVDTNASNISLHLDEDLDESLNDAVHDIEYDFKHWDDNRTGIVGDIYIYDNPYNNKTEIFKLKTERYDYLPINQSSNNSWKYLGPKHRFERGEIGDIYLRDNQNESINKYDFFKLADIYSSSFPFPNGESSDSQWEYIPRKDSGESNISKDNVYLGITSWYKPSIHTGKSQCLVMLSGSSGGYSIRVGLSQADKNGMPIRYDSYETVVDGTPSYTSELLISKEDESVCTVTDVYIDGLGRGAINTSDNTQSTTVTIFWGQDYGREYPFTGYLRTSQVLALPIAAKISGDDSIIDNMRFVVSNRKLDSEYRKYTKLIETGETGVNGSIFGFSVDFLELKTIENIEDFLIESAIEPAKKMGLIDPDLEPSNLASMLRKEILFLLNQDAHEEYGSTSHVKASLTMSYTQAASSGWQVNSIDMGSVTSKSIAQALFRYPITESSLKEIKERFDVSGVTEILEYFIVREQLHLYPDLGSDFAKSILKERNGFLVDFEKGLVSNSEHYGGYLGRTYLDIASDIYDKETIELTYSDILLVRLALNAIGIDTYYPYGSLRNVKSSLLMRIDSNIQPTPIPSAFFLSSLNVNVKNDLSSLSLYDAIDEGYSPEIIDNLVLNNGIHFNEHVKSLLFRTYAFSGVAGLDLNDETQVLKDSLYNSLNHLNDMTKNVSNSERILDYDDEGNPYYGIPMTDEAYAKSILYESGFSKADVEGHNEYNRAWKKLIDQQSVRPYLKDIIYHSTPQQERAFYAQLKAFENDSGRTKYNLHDMWSHSFNKLADSAAEYVGASVSLKAKMMGKTPWIEPTRQIDARIYTGFTVHKRRWGSVFWHESWDVEPEHWVISGNNLNYSALLGDDEYAFFNMQNIELVESAGMDTNISSPIYRLMHSTRFNECFKPPYESSDIYRECDAEYVTRGSYTDAESRALSHLIKEYLLFSKTNFKTVKTNEIFLDVLKGMLPLWGTIEDIKAGNVGMSIIGVVGDIMFFVPVADEVIGATTYTVKAMKSASALKNTRFLKAPVSLNKGGKVFGVNGMVDTNYYIARAKAHIKRIPLSILNELNPIGAGSLDDLISLGRIPTPNVSFPDRFIPDVNFDTRELAGARIFDEIVIAIEKSDGTFIVNGSIIAIKHNGVYYKATVDLYNNYHLIISSGNKIPVIKNGDSWEVDFSKSIEHFDYSGMSKVDVDDLSLYTSKNGVYNIEDKHFIDVDGEFYEVIWDPVYEMWYMYDEQWNRLFVSGTYNNKWYIDTHAGVCIR